MAEQRPLVLINGNIQQLPTGDTVAGSGAVSETIYSERVDFVDDVIYKGWASVGSDESFSLWKIQRISFVGVDDNISITWANGNANFSNVWLDRASLLYS